MSTNYEIFQQQTGANFTFPLHTYIHTQFTYYMFYDLSHFQTGKKKGETTKSLWSPLSHYYVKELSIWNETYSSNSDLKGVKLI